MTDTPVHIDIRHLTKRFGSVSAVRDVSLEIPRGSFTTLLGPSGCGKTTILRTLAGFYDADEGDLYIGGRRVNDIPSHRRNAAMVFQDYALFPHMTVFENVSYGLKIAGLRGEALRQKVEKVLQDLGLQGLGDRMPGMISGGQQQRVALARVLVMEPEVLLLDEPLSNLDAKLRISIRAELRLIQQRVGITTVYVTHDQEEALSISDRIAVMYQGEVVQYGTPWEIYYTPAKEFVADFVGIANFIRGRILEAGAGQSRLDFGGVPIVVEAAGKAVQAGQEAVLSIRPEAIELSTAPPPAPGVNLLEGKIRTHMFVGQWVRYWVDVPLRDAAPPREFIVDVPDPRERGILDGQVFLRLDPRKLHLLESEMAAPPRHSPPL
ncbi:MAG TPA: ABC transporter ATP-binding protein [Candidatus Acidoferrum sp.]|nr:ABC transporter ATP-binding protein [Candidatus Acidoferrum sp.]